MSLKVSCFLTVFLAVFLNLITPAQSQLSSLYHEPDLDWLTLTTDHFSIHYPAGFEEIGYKVGAICEEVYEPVSRSLNFYPGRTHVVVHTRVDFFAGEVAFLPWRMELSIVEPQDNVMGSRDEWLRVLITHEFTHIVHLQKRRGLSTLTYPFLGDFNSFWQMITPKWFSEGYATFNETQFTLGGRGRNPYHWMQMNAPLQAGRPWRLRNTNYISHKNRPVGMEYISGYYLSKYIREHYGTDVWARIFDRYSAFPLLGFNRAVKSVTGEKLKKIYGDMLDEFTSSSQKREIYYSPIQIWREPKRPENQHSPRWVDQDHLLVYRTSFDDLPELTEIDRNGRYRQIQQRLLANRDNSFSVGKKFLVWAELRPHPRFTGTIYSDLKLYNWRTKKVVVLTHNDRVYSPDLSPDETQVVAVQTALPTAQLVTVNLESRKLNTLLNIPNATILNPRWSQDGEWIAFAIKDSTGQQDIAIVEVQTGRWRYLFQPDIFHDNNPCWTPDGRYVLYASDRSGIFNIWAVEVSTGKQWQVTDLELGAFTPDVSPDGRELALSSYTYTGLTAATISLDSSLWLPSQTANWRTEGENTLLKSSMNPVIFTTTDTTESVHVSSSKFRARTKPYRPWRQLLRPQGWFPLPFLDENGGRLGLFAVSQDVLHRHSWQGFIASSLKDIRPSISFLYAYRRWWPEFYLQPYSLSERISYLNYDVQEQHGWWRKQGVKLTVALPLIPESNVYTTILQPFLGMEHQSITNLPEDMHPELRDSFQKNYRGLRLGFNLVRTGQALRDIVPHQAWFLTAFADWSSPALASEFKGQQVSGQIKGFLPTPIPHHQIELLGKYQNRRGNFNYSDYGARPIGYSDNGARQQLRLRLANHFPIAYLEWPIPLLPIFIDYLAGSLFYDWGTSWDKEFGSSQWGKVARHSTGVQLTSINYFFQRVRIRLGVAFFYHSESQAWKTVPVIEF